MRVRGWIPKVWYSHFTLVGMDNNVVTYFLSRHTLHTPITQFGSLLTTHFCYIDFSFSNWFICVTFQGRSWSLAIWQTWKFSLFFRKVRTFNLLFNRIWLWNIYLWGFQLITHVGSRLKCSYMIASSTICLTKTIFLFFVHICKTLYITLDIMIHHHCWIRHSQCGKSM